MKAIDLRVEYLKEPIGLDIYNPRFFYKCEGAIIQKAYQIKVYKDDELYFDTNKVLSSSNTHIEYNGKKLEPKTLYKWSVTLWDQDDNMGEEVYSTFEMGLGDTKFNASWISGDYKVVKNTRYGVDYFKKTFSINKKIKKARLYITAKGCYKVNINNKDLEDFILAPGSTDYRKRLQYQTYDVTKYLKDDNEIVLLLSDGFYRGSIGCFGKTNTFGRTTSIIAELDIIYSDNTKDIVSTDNTWLWSNDGAIRFADLKDGEIVDLNNIPSFSSNAIINKEKNNFKIVSSNNVYVNKHERFKGEVIKRFENKAIIDFKQNIAGLISFKVKAKKNDHIKILLGEMLDQDGNFTQANFQIKKPVKEFGMLDEIFLATSNLNLIKGELQLTPLQSYDITLADGLNYYESSFSVSGFRYALVETNINIDDIKFESIAIYSSLEETGSFNSSNKKLNRLYLNTLWSMKNNFLDVPTDCPTRERLGWTGDGQIFFNTASYMALTAPFYRKWLNDFKDNQFKNGKISAVVPYNGVSLIYDNTGASAGWADAAILIPYRFYLRYGDINILKDSYDMMRKSIMYMIKNCGEIKKDKNNPYSKYIYEKGVQLGEWLEPLEFKDMNNNSGAKVIKQAEVATAFLYNSLNIFNNILDILNINDDKELIEEYLIGTKSAYNFKFLKDFDYTTTRQAKMVRPLEFNIADSKTKEKLAKALASSVNLRNGKIGTGFLSTSYLLKVLADNGYSELAYKTLFNEECPGFMYQVNNGATTMWEAWENDLVSSKDHYSFGSVSEFLYSYTLGIKVDGLNKFIIDPKVTRTLEYANGSYDSIYGKVEVAWKWANDKIILDVIVPSNTKAKIIINKEEKCVNAGNYHFEY